MSLHRRHSVPCPSKARDPQADGGWQDAPLTPDSPLHSLENRPLEAVGNEPLEHVEMDRLRSTCRAPNRRTSRRLRWFSWRRKPASASTSGTAEIA